jgi:hypothetical protein
MSETRPPMTAGPIERALRPLPRTSVNCMGVAAAGGDAEATDGAVELVAAGVG